jgi:hypothetical protein
VPKHAKMVGNIYGNEEISMERTYVYPNVSELNRRGRGSLNQRWTLASQTGCQLVEVPADFIKNSTEVNITGLALCSLLTRDAISALYDNSSVPPGVQYILHSEPSLPRNDNHGLIRSARLEWNNQEWVESLTGMLILVSEHFGVPPIAVEIHPGDSRNSNINLINASRLLLEKYDHKFALHPMILLENRTDQFISSGEDLARFWETASKTGRDLIELLGIVLDIQQLFTRVKKDFLRHFYSVPDEAIKGVHIHTKHRTPSRTDLIPWNSVFSRLNNLNQSLIINPEIHQRNQVPVAISFCENMFKECDAKF